jgi:beta-glucanase (GH16 family)
MSQFSFFLKSKLGLIPGAYKVEHNDKIIRDEYARLLEYEAGGEPNHYLELKAFVTSQDFKDRKKEINSQRFKDTDAYAKLQEFKEMKKSPEFKNYMKFISSPRFDGYKKMENSQDLKKHEELRDLVNTPEFTDKEKKQQFKNEKNSGKFKDYYALRNSKMYDDYIQLQDSKELKHFNELEKYVRSDEFKEIEKYMKSADKFKKSEEYQKLLEFKSLDRSPKIIWYFKQMKLKKYDEVKRYDISFYDNFENKSLDKKKWITTYFWGNKLLKEGYSIVNDAHLLTNGENVVVEDSKLKIITKKESVNGKAWDPAIGFYQQDFNYTSGIISSGESFRQKYGIFEAKVKLNAHPSVFHSFWMLSDKMIPHVDIFRFMGKNKSSMQMDCFWGDASVEGSIKGQKGTASGIDFSRGFNIVRLEWFPDRLVWKINSEVVLVQTSNVPQEEMYISFSSGIIGKEAVNLHPVSMEVDWVRCQKMKDNLPAE